MFFILQQNQDPSNTMKEMGVAVYKILNAVCTEKQLFTCFMWVT